MGTPFDPGLLADRVRARLEAHSPVAKRMFGGLAFMLDGNMLCCVSGKGMMARVGAAQEAQALSRPHAAPCLGTGRRMPGFIMVSPEGLIADDDLNDWLDLSLAYVAALPAKAATKPAGRGRRNGGA